MERAAPRQPTTTFAGEHYQLTDAICEPKPVQSPLPLLIGGKGDRMLGVVARHADEWNMWGLADAIAERAAVLDRAARPSAAIPSEIKRSAQALVLLTDDPAKAGRFREDAAAAPPSPAPPTTSPRPSPPGSDVGLDEVIVPDFTLGRGARRLERMDAIIEQVAPELPLRPGGGRLHQLDAVAERVVDVTRS